LEHKISGKYRHFKSANPIYIDKFGHYDMKEQILGRRGDFQRSLPGNGIPDHHVQCVICKAIIPEGLIPVSRHNAECGGKVQYDKMETLSALYRNKFITKEDFIQGAKDIYQIKEEDIQRVKKIEEDLLKIYE
jgi:hypothetical protein